MAWILAQQVRVARVRPRLLLAPLALAFFGLRSLPATAWRVPADLALLAVSAVLSLVLGGWRRAWGGAGHAGAELRSAERRDRAADERRAAGRRRQAGRRPGRWSSRWPQHGRAATGGWAR
jgi:hypothetical protein